MRGNALPTVIDVEASGFGPHSYPIEVGVVLADGGKYCALISPAPDWTHWDPEAERVHNVSREILEQHGKPMAMVAEELNGLLQDQTVYTDGWVVDKPWLDRLFFASRIDPMFSISALEMILTEAQMDAWHACKDRVIEDLNLQRHRASYDALIVQETWARTRG